MVSEIRIYVEGGGDKNNGKARLREGFSNLFYNGLGRRISVIPCGPRNNTYRDFKRALESHPTAFNILLVDSEGPVKDTPWRHLHNQDGWQQISGTTDDQCHLMVQMMEAWFLADKDTLRQFYGQGFKVNSLPKNSNVEAILKQTIETALKAATQNTTKGEYHKIRHGPKILEQLDVARVRQHAAHCDRLFNILIQKIATTI